MTLRFIGYTMVAAMVLSLGPRPAAGQTPASLPRTVEGRPDLSGVWQAVNTAAWDLEAHHARDGVPAGLGVVDGDEIPYQPWAAAKRDENFANRATADPEGKCFLPGVPRATYLPFPFQILQNAGHIAIVYEYAHTVRRIFMDTPHPPGPISWYMRTRAATGRGIRSSWT